MRSVDRLHRPLARNVATLERTLDGFAGTVAVSEGMNLADTMPLTALIVKTVNSVYRLIILRSPNLVMVQGGKYFSAPTTACVAGSTLGGSCLKMAWIGCGFSMEIYGPQGRVVTSPVCAIYELQQCPLCH
jgi:hypothetical protein